MLNLFYLHSIGKQIYPSKTHFLTSKTSMMRSLRCTADAGKKFFGLRESHAFVSGGSLYINTPKRPGQKVLLMGGAEGIERKEPVAWTFNRKDGGKTFYTSLGHVGDFAQCSNNRGSDPPPPLQPDGSLRSNCGSAAPHVSWGRGRQTASQGPRECPRRAGSHLIAHAGPAPTHRPLSLELRSAGAYG